jgi:valyl-tRNA synthetase
MLLPFFREQLAVIDDHYSKYRMSDALMASYKLMWDDFCSWYLEMVKPAYVEGAPSVIDRATYDATLGYFEQLLKVLHPWMPFITEELWHHLKERASGECIIVADWPKQEGFDADLLNDFSWAAEAISQVRNLRSSKGLSPREPLSLLVRSDKATYSMFSTVIAKLANLDRFEITDSKPDNCFSFLVGKDECFVPVSGNVDVDAERDRLKKELEYNQGFLKSVQAKLANERFVSNAKPEIVENEKKKLADALAKIKVIEEQLTALG